MNSSVHDEKNQLTLFDEEIKNPTECFSDSVLRWRMYIDGASRSNPGKSGAGFSISSGEDIVVENGFFIGQKTNNQAEYYALLLGLFAMKEYIQAGEQLLVFSDSQLLVRQMTGLYKIKDPTLQQLKLLAQNLSANIQVTFCHIYREHNSRADFLANRGIDKMVLMPNKFIQFLNQHNIF